MKMFRRSQAKIRAGQVPDDIRDRAFDIGPEEVAWDTGEGVVVRIRAMEGQYLEVYNALHDTWIGLSGYGDWIRADNADDVYPIGEDVFPQTYEPDGS